MHVFTDLIDRLNAAAGPERASIEAQIREASGAEQAVLVLDMSQFSLCVRRDGILPYLGHIRRMQTLMLDLDEQRVSISGLEIVVHGLRAA